MGFEHAHPKASIANVPKAGMSGTVPLPRPTGSYPTVNSNGEHDTRHGQV
jgi:hypothetical protein